MSHRGCVPYSGCHHKQIPHSSDETSSSIGVEPCLMCTVYVSGSIAAATQVLIGHVGTGSLFVIAQSIAKTNLLADQAAITAGRAAIRGACR